MYAECLFRRVECFDGNCTHLEEDVVVLLINLR